MKERRRVAVDGTRNDWPRTVAKALTDAQNDIKALEDGTITATVRAITATGSVADADYLILANATGGAITVTLPAAASSEGRMLVVKKTDASGNAVTIDGASAETIDGTATQALAAQYDALTIACDGTGWVIV